MRNYDDFLFRQHPFSNRMMVVAFTMGLLLQFAVTEVDFLIKAFGTRELSWREWGGLLLLSMVPLLSHEIIVAGKRLRRSRSRLRKPMQ